MDKAFLFHLNRTRGVRYYIAEMDDVGAGMLNEFLAGNEKDMSLLEEAVCRVGERIPQQAGMELLQKWSDIYDYNATVEDSQKIRVIGIDKSLEDKSAVSRDSVMMSTFLVAVETIGAENESFYGLFGLFHVLQGGMNENNFLPFAARLKLAGFDVTSVVCLDINSEIYMPANTGYPTPPGGKMKLLSMDGPVVLVKGINDLKKASVKNSITLFDLDRPDSPYKHDSKLTQVKTNFFGNEQRPHDTNAVTTDFAQYAILLRNGNAVTPLE